MEATYSFEQTEKRMQKFWEDHAVYRYDPDGGKETFSIDTPPPTVSGSLHIGHIFSYTQAEIIARFKRMQGCAVFYPFGFDDNGLPTERLVERETGHPAKDIPRREFRQKCLEITDRYEEDFKALWKSLGFSVDWFLQFKTAGPLAQKISQRSFLELVQKGKAYCKDSPVLWCTECRTSIAQAELDTKEVQTTFNYIPFRVGGDMLTVATTRPELLYGCVCLFVNPDDPRYRPYIGKTAVVPLYDCEIPVLADGKVGMEKGTGVVMCATFGDTTDVQWYQEHRLPYRPVILPNGLLKISVPYIGGLSVKAARKEILRLLSLKGLLLKSETIAHAVAIHERCGKEIEILPSKQWYIDILTEKDRFLKAADEIRWYPSYMKSRYVDWVENLKWDWCISRQRYFGVPFPVWYCRRCGKPAFAKEAQLPVDPAETSYEGTCSCGCAEFVPETAVLDTWATSSLTPLIHSRFGEPDDRRGRLLPMSMRTQAHEIIRTWAFYTIVKSLYHTGRIPWKDIMICGFVLAKKGEKISKSKNNAAFSPPALIRTYSADALRYWAANAKLGTDTFFSTDELDLSRRFLTKLWNASKFAVLQLQDYEPGETPDLLPIDRWMLERAKQTVSSATGLLGQYEIGAARHEIDDLFWKDFCDNYLEIVKERLYEPEIYGAERRKAAQYTLYTALLMILKLYAIYVPHITEAVYQDYFRRHEKTLSIHLLLWSRPEKADGELLDFGEEVKAAVSAVRKYKSENNLSRKAPVGQMVIRAKPRHAAWFRQTESDLLSCCNAQTLKYVLY